jgi:Xaa-Pro dipeptidase
MRLKQVMHNAKIIQPGLTDHEFNAKSWRMPEKNWFTRYGVVAHGVGLCDEYPAISTHVDMDQGEGYEGEFQTGDVLSCTGLDGGRECVKLEIQVL